MTDNKNLGQIAYEAFFNTPGIFRHRTKGKWSRQSSHLKSGYDNAASAVRRAVIDECIQAISGPLTIAAPPDVISAVQDLNELHIEALEELKGDGS